MSKELGGLEEAKSEALAAFAAIAAVIDLSGEPETPEKRSALDSLRTAAARHLEAALEIVGRAKGGGR
jgi:hypothetical protein